MAKKKLNKSELIRTYAEENPTAKPKAIAEALTAAHGVPFKPQVVSQTLLMAKKAGKLARKSTGIDSAKLLSAASFIRSVGGIANAKQAIDLLAKLHS
jgi:hypothetical protein